VKRPTDPIVYGSKLYFCADDGVSGLALWALENRTGALKAVANFIESTPLPRTYNVVKTYLEGNSLYFVLFGQNQTESYSSLWAYRLDGGQSAVKIADLSDAFSETDSKIIQFNEALYLPQRTNEVGTELFKIPLLEAPIGTPLSNQSDLTLTQTVTTSRLVDTIYLDFAVTVKNKGGETARNVKTGFSNLYPFGIYNTSSFRDTAASMGYLLPSYFSTPYWYIPELTANQTATLSFRLAVFKTAQVINTVYTTVTSDQFDANSADNTAQFKFELSLPPCTGSVNGSLLVDYYTDIVTDDSPIELPNRTATGTYLTTGAIANNLGDQYIRRARGFLKPSESGNYQFFIAGDDNVDVYLSTDENPANKQRIAYVKGYTSLGDFAKFPSQTSVLIPLAAGRRYYVEIVNAEKFGDDFFNLQWAPPSVSVRSAIPAAQIESFCGEPIVISNSCRSQDSLQLVSLYNATNGANWTNKWQLNTPINTWFGVALNPEGCVISINLNNNNLVGNMPNLILPNLELIQIRGGSLRGVLLDFNGCPKLTVIELGNNELSGLIPNFNLPNLERLILSYNQLSGQIPNFNLPKLKSLRLFNNRLMGIIPNFNLPNVLDIDLGSNQLSGIIPNFNLPNITLLYLFNNQLTGSIPDLNTPKLDILVLDGNQLSGCLPASLRAFCGKTVSLDGNPDLATRNFFSFCANNTGACDATPLYCASKGVAPWEYAISNVTLNTMNNNSEKFKDITTLGYSDFTNAGTTLTKGQTYPLSITPLLSWIGNLPNAYCRVWIDFNQNNTFEASELVLEKTNANPLTQNVLVPSTALTGFTRMRVSLKNGSYPTPCEAFEKGEVEDYTIAIAESVGGGTTTNDLAVSLTSTPSVYRQYTKQNFKISAKNNSNQAFRDVKIDFPFPTKTVSGGVITPSVGTWQEWCSGGSQCYTWTIPSLAANTTATLDVPVYVLDAVGMMSATTHLLSSNPTDNSTTNNTATILIGSINTPLIAPLNQLLNQSLINSKPTELNSIFIQKINPTIADNYIALELESSVNQIIDYQVINAIGTTILNGKLNIEKGNNKHLFNVAQLPKGMYFISINGRLNKFIKI
jgi:hypothetical protein